ncbi:hypothetical protein GE21DRAFT_1216151, partial [Neurospora crassa]
KKKEKTYNTRDSLVVTDPTTSLALTGLSMGERTGSRVFQWVWSYVIKLGRKMTYIMAVISIDVSRNGCDDRDPTSSGYHAEQSSPEHRNECLIELQITVFHRPTLHKY